MVYCAQVGVADGRLRKWLLSIAVFLRSQNQGVMDAVALWKANLDKEFQVGGAWLHVYTACILSC